MIGHAHPRIIDHAEIVYRQFGIRTVRDFDDVLDRADVYCVDNSSTLYEFAAAGKPVVVLNCPRYRKQVHHGLRFWDHVPGIQCEGPEDLAAAVGEALEDPPKWREARQTALDAVYPLHDGRSAERAAALVLELADTLEVDYPDEPAPTIRRHRLIEYVVHGPNGEAEVFLVEGEALKLLRKRNRSGDGWWLEQRVDGETMNTDAHLSPEFEEQAAPAGGAGWQQTPSR